MRTEKNLHPVFFQDIVDLIIRSFDDAYTLHIYRKLHYLIIFVQFFALELHECQITSFYSGVAMQYNFPCPWECANN